MIFGFSTVTDDKVYNVRNYCFLPFHVIQMSLRAVVPKNQRNKEDHKLMDLKIHEFYIYNNFILENVSGKMVTGMF